MDLTKEEKDIARLIQNDLAARKYFFNEAGGMLGLSGKDVLQKVKELLESGHIRKFGAILRHQKAGFDQNALVVWSVPAGREETIGKILAQFSFISHCYQREPAFMTKYNVFTMLHASDKSISALIDEIVRATGISDYLILKSVKEYKKTSPEYF